jgi:hypothetical protein
MLVYKNERAMSFEAFSKKLTKALQYFDSARRAKHDGDVIDWIWRHVQCPELSQHLSALKVGQSIHARTSKQILQEIAKEVPNLYNKDRASQAASHSMGARLAQALIPLMVNCIAVPTALAVGLATMSNHFTSKSGNIGISKATTAPSLRMQIGNYRSSRRRTLNSRGIYWHSSLVEGMATMTPPPQKNPTIMQVTHSVAKNP